jgi:alkylation response protein AidB-like acyl-CoA dehydrogenase
MPLRAIEKLMGTSMPSHATVRGGWQGAVMDSDLITEAARISDEVLFPAALATDRSDVVPVELLDALADAGLYGLTGPAPAGGLEADFGDICAVIERLASGCLTTTFVWVQHLGAVFAAAGSPNEAMTAWLPSLCGGERRAGLALGGALPGPALLVAGEADGGWRLTGTTPFVSGWGRVDVIHTAARTGDGRLVWALLDAAESGTLSVERLELVALNATATVRASFDDHAVPAERVTSVGVHEEGPAPPALVRIHAALPLGVVRRCCALLGGTPLDDELEALRAELDRLDPDTIGAARAAAGELAVRAAAALAVATGSRSLLLSDHAQRLAREALFCLVYALRPDAREAVLRRLTRSGRRDGPGKGAAGSHPE